MAFTSCSPSRARTRSSSGARWLRCARATDASPRARARACACARARRGRLLVECLVAMLLLDASAMVVVGLARGAAQSTLTAASTTAALSVALRTVESSVATSCQAISAGSDALPLGRIAWVEYPHARWRELNVQAFITSSALTGAHTSTMRWRAARLCP